jgi:hypothetical protein
MLSLKNIDQLWKSWRSDALPVGGTSLLLPSRTQARLGIDKAIGWAFVERNTEQFMSNVGSAGRSFRVIEIADLRRLALIAQKDQNDFFENHPEWAELYSGRKICITLCQGAALHYIDGSTGINDFDVYTFYRKHPAKGLYSKRLKSYDLGDEKFGQSRDRPDFIGRRVDCLARSIDALEGADGGLSIQRYLAGGKTETARFLAGKAVVLLEPNMGKVIWPR